MVKFRRLALAFELYNSHCAHGDLSSNNGRSIVSATISFHKIYIRLHFIRITLWLQYWRYFNRQAQIFCPLPIKFTGQCPSLDGSKGEWNHFMTKIMKKSYSDLLVMSSDEAYAWRSDVNISKWETSCFKVKLQGWSIACKVSVKDLIFVETSTLQWVYLWAWSIILLVYLTCILSFQSSDSWKNKIHAISFALVGCYKGKI